MNKIVCVLFLAAVIAIATSAPTSSEPSTTRTPLILMDMDELVEIGAKSSEPSTTRTPLGLMNMDELVEVHIQHKFHRYDESLPSVDALFNTYIGKIEDIIANPETSRPQVKYYVLIKGYMTDFLKDIENEEYFKECGLKQVALHYHHLFKELSKSESNQNIKDLFESFNNDYNNAFDKESDTFEAATIDLNRNDALATEVRQKAQLPSICSKFLEHTYRRVIPFPRI